MRQAQRGRIIVFNFYKKTLLVVTGGAILLKKLWAKTILTISVVVLMLYLLYTSTFEDRLEGILDQIGFYILSIGSTVFLILLLHNEKVLIEFEEKYTGKEVEDILDHFE